MNGKTNVTTGPGSDELLQVPLEAPTALTADAGNSQVTLKWTDPIDKYAVVLGDTAETSDQLVSEFDHTIVVRKEGSNPTDLSDGTLVTTSSSRNQYQTSGYIDTGLTNDIEYHYGIYTANKANIFSPGAFTHATPMSYRAASTFPVGTIFKMNIQSTPYEFIVVQQGVPTSGYTYSSNCNGTWLLMKNTFIEKQFSSYEYDSSFNDSDMKKYLDGDFYNSFDSTHKSKIKRVTVPYQYWSRYTDYSTATSTGYVFLPSMAELGFASYIDGGHDGSALDYFKVTPDDEASSLRVSGDRKVYWSRTGDGGRNPPHIAAVQTNGSWYRGADTGVDDTHSVRPMIIIDPNAMFNDNGELLIE